MGTVNDGDSKLEDNVIKDIEVSSNLCVPTLSFISYKSPSSIRILERFSRKGNFKKWDVVRFVDKFGHEGVGIIESIVPFLIREDDITLYGNISYYVYPFFVDGKVVGNNFYRYSNVVDSDDMSIVKMIGYKNF